MFLGRNASDTQNSPIKFAQSISITVLAGNTTATGTISQSVDTTKSLCLNNGIEEPDGYTGEKSEAAANFTSISSGMTTEVTARLNSASASDRVVDVYVVEFYPWAVKDVQHGTVTLGSGTTSADSSALARTVDENYSSVVHCGQTSNSTSQSVNRTNCTTVVKSGGSAITASRVASTDSLTVYFSVIEFQSSVIKSRQQATITFSSSSLASSTATISSVDPNYTLLLWGGMKHSAFQSQNLDVELTDTTTLTATQGGAASVDNTRVAVVTVIEFNKKLVKARTAARDLLADGVGTYDHTVTAVKTDKSILSRAGFSTNNTYSNSNLAYVRTKLSSTTNVQTKRNTTGFGVTSTSSWNLMEFY